ncbi:MAG: hypothetical protein JWM16_4219 [Verrucomicrobiales bacterium]|nr:hypothetical protein [Verrucomicrobiales bacterium]
MITRGGLFCFGFVWLIACSAVQLKAATGPGLEGAGQFNFSASEFRVTENETFPAPFGNIPPAWFLNPKLVRGALVTVVRTGGSRGKVLVDYTTINNFALPCGSASPSSAGLAVPNCDYYPTSGTLVFDDFQMSTNFLVEVTSDGVANGTKRVNVALSNPRAAPPEDALQIVPTLGSTATGAVVIVEINNDVGGFSIERAAYRVDEAGGGVFVDVILPGGAGGSFGTVEMVTRPVFGFPTEAGSDYADAATTVYPNTLITDGAPALINAADYTPTSVVVTFPPAVTRQRVFIPVLNDSDVEFNEDILVELRNPSPPWHLGINSSARVTILNDDQPAGAVDREWNPEQVPSTTPAYNETPGANGMVNGIAVQADQKTLIGGSFTAYNAAARRGVARINNDGSLDTSFDPGPGANGVVTDVAAYAASFGDTNFGKTIVVGGFSSFGNISRPGVVRLNANGSVDPSFNPGAGADGIVRAVAVLDSGRVYVAGDFTSFNGIYRPGIVRLLPDGSVDPAFDTGAGADGSIWALAIEGGSGGLILHAEQSGLGPAEFRTNINTGATSGIVRITFEPQCVPDALRIYHGPNLIFDSGLTNNYGGDASCSNFLGPLQYLVHYGSGPYTNLTLVVNEGGGDPGTIWSLDVEVMNANSGNKLYVGGEFARFGDVNRNGIARLDETGAVDPDFDPGAGLNGPVYALAVQSDSKVLAGGAFTRADILQISHLVRFNHDGSTDQSFAGASPNEAVFAIKLQPDDKILLGGIFTSIGEVRRKGVARLMKTGVLDTSFLDTGYNQFAGLVNEFSFELPNFVNGLALQADGSVLIGGSFHRLGGNPNSNNVSPDRSFTRQQKATRYNVARLIGGATPGPGTIAFPGPEYAVDENFTTLNVPLRRIDGRLGTIRATARTGSGSALEGVDFIPINTQAAWWEFSYPAPRSVGFTGDLFVAVPILDDQIIEPDEDFQVSLSAPVGSLNLGGELIPLGANVARSKSMAVIRENDQPPAVIGFAASSYSVSETGKTAVIKIFRTGNTNSTVTVAFEVRDGTAVAGVDYVGTNALFTFRPREIAKAILLDVLDDQVADGNKTAQLLLTNISGNNSLGLSAATLNILDDESAPRLMAPQRMSNGTFQMQFAGDANASVVVQASSDLIHWTNVSTNSAGQSIFLDLNAGAFPQRFYRAITAE